MLQGVNVFVVKRNQHKVLKIILTKSVAFIKFKLYPVDRVYTLRWALIKFNILNGQLKATDG